MVFSPLFGLTHRHLKKPKGLAASKAKKESCNWAGFCPLLGLNSVHWNYENGVLSILNFESKQFRILVLY